MNLAIFLPNWIGDVVMATPAIRALRDHFRDARLIGVLKPYVAGVLDGSPWFDEFLFHNDRSWSRGVLATAWKLRRRRIDLAVLFSNSFRTALVARVGGCRRRIGFARRGRSLLLTDVLPPVRDERGRLTPSPIIHDYNRLAEAAGCPRPGMRMQLFTTPLDEARADHVWSKTDLCCYDKVICLNPGAAFGSAKYWPMEHFVQLSRLLVDRHGFGVLVLCGPTERELCRDIVQRSERPGVVGLSEFPPSLGLTKACVRRADLLITTDSGPRHFATAFNRSVVTLFGPTHIEWTETYHPSALHLQKKVPCGPCQQRVCPEGHHRCMKELTPAEVYSAAIGLLDRSREVRHSA